ncbi:MAG: hypothetical protein AAB967_03235, partial [Patescibacteria group bacterium]
SENAGWIDFGNTAGNVHVTDSVLTGYAWGENIGWVSLNCSNTSSCATVDYKVANNNEGTLSGHAWSENAGWIQFDPSAGGVAIDSSGNFSGYAWGENVGWISFNCSNISSCATVSYYISTDWRPSSTRTTPAPGPVVQVASPATGGGGGGSAFPVQQPSSTAVQEIEKPAEPIVEEPVPKIGKKVEKIFESLIPSFLKPQPKVEPPKEPPIKEIVPKEAPPALRSAWLLLDPVPIGRFVLAPLPREIRILAQKFPDFGGVLAKIGVRKITDVEKLRFSKLTLPRLGQAAGLLEPDLRAGAFGVLEGLPAANLPYLAKQALPSEIVFVRTGESLIDVNVALTIGEKGKPQQRITAIAGKTMNLVVKAEGKAKTVKGYIIFKRKTPRPASFEVPARVLTASLFFVQPVFAEPQEKPVVIEEEFLLAEFEYTDPDGDGIYTADVLSPVVDGEYEIITVIAYEDPALGTKEIRLTAVIDPEGYVFEKTGNKETRIPGAVVSFLWLNPATAKYELWPAKEYRQENPQVTDVRGTYSFLVPEGSYALRVHAPGYLAHEGKPFLAES